MTYKIQMCSVIFARHCRKLWCLARPRSKAQDNFGTIYAFQKDYDPGNANLEHFEYEAVLLGEGGCLYAFSLSISRNQRSKWTSQADDAGKHALRADPRAVNRLRQALLFAAAHQANGLEHGPHPVRLHFYHQHRPCSNVSSHSSALTLVVSMLQTGEDRSSSVLHQARTAVHTNASQSTARTCRQWMVSSP